jgi:hypothetical protein
MKRIGFLGMICFFLVACQHQGEMSEKSLSTTIRTYSPVPTLTHYASPSSSAIPSQSPSPTPIPSQSAIPASVTALDLPSWLINPNTNVLMYRLMNGTNGNGQILPTVFFYTPDTKEQFSIDVPIDLSGAFVWWHDNMHAVFQSGSDTLFLLDLSNSTLVQLSTNDSLFANYEWVPPLWDSGYTVDYGTDANTGRNIAVVTETGTGQKRIFDNGNYISWFSQISPNHNYLAIMQSAAGGPIMEGQHISIYNFADQSLILTVDDYEINSISFFPDDDRLVYMRGLDMPCIVEITTRAKTCVQTIHNTYPAAWIYLRGLTYDRQKFIFLHVEHGQSGVRNGGLCFYSLDTGKLNCPTDGLKILVDKAVTDFILSPDEKYIAFIYEEYPPDADISEALGLSVIGTDGSKFIDLGIPIYGHPLIQRAVNWRPLP